MPRRKALPTTDTDDRLMAAAAIMGERSSAEDWIEHAGGDRNAQRVVAEGEGQILPDVGDGGLGQTARAHDAREIALEQGDPRALDRHVGAGAHGNADIGRGQRRRVVDAVAGHGDLAALPLSVPP